MGQTLGTESKQNYSYKNHFVAVYTATGFGLIILSPPHNVETSDTGMYTSLFKDVMAVAHFSCMGICHYSLKVA
jgi:hypothetical protein